MKFMVCWSLPQSSYKETVARFLEGGAQPPEGVKIIGRWHGMSHGRGVAIAETSDPKALYAWQAEWMDLLPMEVIPCLEDEDAGEVLSKLKS